MTRRLTIARTASFGVVLVHGVLLAAYTFPPEWVPTRMRFWSQAYARVLFHQDWRLFAPDPPTCGCTLEVKGAEDETWIDLSSRRNHFVWQRMCANACRYAEAGRSPGSAIVTAPLPLARSLENMAAGVPRNGPLMVRMLRCEDRPVTIELVAHR